MLSNLQEFMRILIALLLTACTPLAVPTASTIAVDLLNDGVFRIGIKTVQIYPDRNDVTDVLVPAAVAQNQQGLILQFDDLTTSYRSYTAKITHCNADWSKSTLSNLDFLTEFNSFPITQYAFSSDTHIPYIHYWFSLPSVKLSGNFVLTVYQDDGSPVFSKRFMVYGKQAQLSSLNDASGASQLNNKQGISLKLNYPQLEVLNAATQFEVSIRQNQRWDNLIQNIPATFYREAQREIEYRINDEAYMHDGGNEYRFFDLRSIINPGQNVSYVEKISKPYRAFISNDRSRDGDRYAQYLDINGNYVIQNYDNSLQYSENYIKANFTLTVPKPITGKVFINARFVDNAFSKETEMRYDSARKEYRQELLVKQGWYNYQYIVKGGTVAPNLIEGNHFETENLYEVLVYYKSLQPRADLLVGYLQFTKNSR
jgi:hypothetical protein